MISIGVVAWVCKRAAKIPEDLALALPMVFGGLIGGIQAYESAHFGSGILLRGVFLYGAGATIAARLADELLVRVGLLKQGPTSQEIIKEEKGKLLEEVRKESLEKKDG
jgi:hypothetical protein